MNEMSREADNRERAIVYRRGYSAKSEVSLPSHTEHTWSVLLTNASAINPNIASTETTERSVAIITKATTHRPFFHHL